MRTSLPRLRLQPHQRGAALGSSADPPGRTPTGGALLAAPRSQGGADIVVRDTMTYTSQFLARVPKAGATERRLLADLFISRLCDFCQFFHSTEARSTIQEPHATAPRAEHSIDRKLGGSVRCAIASATKPSIAFVVDLASLTDPSMTRHREDRKWFSRLHGGHLSAQSLFQSRMYRTGPAFNAIAGSVGEAVVRLGNDYIRYWSPCRVWNIA